LTSSSHRSSRGTQAIGRAAALLRALAYDNHHGQGLSELAQRLGLETPTAYRILRRLVEEDLVRQDPLTRAYHLGPLVYELGLHADLGNALRDRCRPSLERLAAQSGDTAFLIAPRGAEGVCLDRAEGSFRVQAMLLEPGQRRPTGVGAGSLACLACLAPPAAQALLQANAARLPDPVDDLFACLVRGREAGYVLKRSAELPEIISVGVAIRDAAGVPLASLSISGLGTRITSRLTMLVAMLRDEAGKVQASLRESP
jgi:DNA-binding IclR family transcriptional regulator